MIGEIIVRTYPAKPGNRGFIALVETSDGKPIGKSPITAQRVRVVWKMDITRPYDLRPFISVLTALVTAYDTTV